MIDLSQVGAHVKRDTVHFGIYLPKIGKDESINLTAKVSYVDDFAWENFFDCTLQYKDSNDGFPFYEGDLDLSGGKKGIYRYQYEINKGDTVYPRWASDPFARLTAAGHRSAFLYGDEENISVPALDIPSVTDLIVYECNVSEYNRTFEGFIRNLDYLQALGINAVEFLPLTNVVETYNWGYVPLNLFAPDERFGTPNDLKKLVKACHERGIAVILDVVYNHISGNFGYNTIYDQIGIENPITGRFCKPFDSLSDVDYSKKFAREFILSVNCYYLDEFGVDGFRYDFTPGYFDGVHIGNMGLSHLLWSTHEYAKSMGRSNIIQCIEHFDSNILEAFNKTYANACWYENFRANIEEHYSKGSFDEGLIRLLDLDYSGYASRLEGAGDDFVKSPFVYLETHDSNRLISYFPARDGKDYFGVVQGDRYTSWYLTQPYVIALFTGQGTPMLHNGQEFGENYVVPKEGMERILNFRFLRWENTEDRPGRMLLSLYQRLISLRKRYPSLRNRGLNSFYYYDRYDPQSGGAGDFRSPSGVYFFKRQAGNEVILVALNFTNQDLSVPHPFPAVGRWRDLLHGFIVVNSLENRCPAIIVPSNYGRIYIFETEVKSNSRLHYV
jgi:maltooligosyltrehalose trehalohydrolase